MWRQQIWRQIANDTTDDLAKLACPTFTAVYNFLPHILIIHLQDLKTAGVMPIRGRLKWKKMFNIRW